MHTRYLKWDYWWSKLDPAWQALIRANLDPCTPGIPPDADHIAGLQELACTGHGIKDLGPVAAFPSLTCLDISETSVTDLSPLVNLPGLEELHACLCRIEDWEVLRYLPNLKILDISYPGDEIVPDLTVMPAISSLKELYINHCEIRSLEPLVHLADLEVISLYFNPLPMDEVENFRVKHPDCKVMF